MCLVTVWDTTTLTQCMEHDKNRADESRHRYHAELVGILVNNDPRPKETDCFSGLVYGYASDEQLRARMKK